MQAQYLNWVIEAVKEVFEEYFDAECIQGQPYVITNDLNQDHISGIIHITGEKNGAFILVLDEDGAKRIASSIMNEPKKTLDKSVIDAIGELINTFSGHAKGKLSKFGFTFQLNPPQMTVGKNLRLKDCSYAPYIAVPFTSRIGAFMIQVSIR